MESLSAYIWPDGQMPKIVVLFLAAFGVLWLFWWRRLHASVGSALADLDDVPAVLQKLAAVAGEKTAKQRRAAADEVWQESVRGTRLERKCAVSSHIRNLYMVGIRDGRIELDQLIRRTYAKALPHDGALRVLLSAFVVIGLVGTLFGIADAVGAFRTAVETGKTDSTAERNLVDLTRMLSGLRGAFGPSIAGVSLSIVAALLHAWSRARAARFLDRLRALTLDELVPELVPTVSQRVQMAAQRTLKAASRVVQFAENIDQRSEKIDDSLTRTAATASELASAMALMNTSVNTASGTTERALSELGERIAAFSSALDRWAHFETRFEEYQRRNLEIAEGIQQGNTAIRGAVQGLEREIPSSLEKVSGAVTGLFLPVERAAGDLANVGVGFANTCTDLVGNAQKAADRLQESLGAEFKAWRGEVEHRAEEDRRVLGALKEPFERAAKDLQDQTINSIKQIESMMRDARRDNEHLLAALRELTGPLHEIAAKAGPEPQTAVSATVNLSAADRELFQAIAAALRKASMPAPVSFTAPPDFGPIVTVLERIEAKLTSGIAPAVASSEDDSHWTDTAPTIRRRGAGR